MEPLLGRFGHWSSAKHRLTPFLSNFLYAEDAARAFDFVLHKGHTGEVYNIGSPNEVTNLQVRSVELSVFSDISMCVCVRACVRVQNIAQGWRRPAPTRETSQQLPGRCMPTGLYA